MNPPGPPPPFSRVHQLLQGYQASQILFTVVKLGVADVLKGEPKSGSAVAKELKVHEENLGRLLRAAAGLGIFNRDPVSLDYSLNEMSELLLDGPKSSKWSILHACEPPIVQAWLNLDKAIIDGSYPWKHAFGVNCFDYYAANPESSDRFNKAMTSLSLIFDTGASLSSNYDFTHVKHVVDVGGGQGAVTVALLRANPHLHGTTFDLPHVIEDAKERHAKDYSDVQSRLTFTGGSFFDSVPAGGDVYTLKWIIHDWSDTKAAEILKTVAKQLSKNGKIIVMEQVVKEIGDTIGGLMDLHMMVVCDAKERTEKQFETLFASAGLKINRFIPLPPSLFHAIEGELI